MKRDKNLFVRSASYGDFIVILPQLFYLIKQGKVKIESIHFLIFNKEGTNPIDIVFGKENFFSKKTYIVKNDNLFNLFKGLIKVRKKIGRVERIYYLNFTIENFINKLLKTSLLSLGWIDAQKVGFRLKRKYSKSHYLSPFLFFSIKSNFIFHPDFFYWYNTIIDIKYNSEPFSTIETSNKNYIVFYCNSKIKTKIWPRNNYIELMKKVSINFEFLDIFLIGGAEDYEYNEKIIQDLNTILSCNINNLAGKMDIPVLLKFLKEAKAFVTNDGFPMHLASIANCPTIAIFTYREEIGAWDPISMDYFHSYRADVACKECYKSFCNDPVCIQAIGVGDIFYDLDLLLRRNVINGNKASLLYPNTCQTLITKDR